MSQISFIHVEFAEIYGIESQFLSITSNFGYVKIKKWEEISMMEEHGCIKHKRRNLCHYPYWTEDMVHIYKKTS